MVVVVRAFDPDIDISNFDSGHAELDRWFKDDAKKRHRYTCFVELAVDDTDNIVGFIATAHAVVAGNSLGMDVRTAPVLLIARMGSQLQRSRARHWSAARSPCLQKSYRDAPWCCRRRLLCGHRRL